MEKQTVNFIPANNDAPLKIYSKDGLLIISIGIDRLDGHEDHLKIPALKFADKKTWIQEIIRELLLEEDGSTLVTELLDSAIINTLENGSIGIAEDSPTFVGTCDACNEDRVPLRHTRQGSICSNCSLKVTSK